MAAQKVYLDYAAATPMDPAVLAAMRPYFSDNFYNPSALYREGQQTRLVLEKARSRIAQVIGSKPSEVVFTGGGSEANNLAVHGVMRHFQDAECIISSIEHDSVIRPAARYDAAQVRVSRQGIIDVTHLESRITEKTVLISIMLANNEVGTLQPLTSVAEIINRVRKERIANGNRLPLYLHTDACQAANTQFLNVARLGVDLMTLNGGKLYGPKGSGILYVRGGIVLEPLVDGGGQERGLRSGTENVASCVGFATALSQAQDRRLEEAARLKGLRMQFMQKLNEQLPQARLNGSLKHRLPSNVHITIPGTDNERLLYGLDEAGIMAAAGSACSAGSDTPSHVLQAMGVSDEEARASLRFTMGRHTTEEAIDYTVATLARLVARSS